MRPCRWCGAGVKIRYVGDVKLILCEHCDRACYVGRAGGCTSCVRVERTKAE